MASLPLVGSVDWKWFIIGIIFAKFVLGWITALIAKARGGGAATAA